MAKKVSEVYRYAVILQQKGDVDRALLLYQRIVEKFPNSKSAVAARARINDIEVGKQMAEEQVDAEKVLQQKVQQHKELQQKKTTATPQTNQKTAAAKAKGKKGEIYPFLASIFVLFGIGFTFAINLLMGLFGPFGRRAAVNAFLGTGFVMAVLALLFGLVGIVKCADNEALRRKSTIWTVVAILAIILLGAGLLIVRMI